MRALCTAPHNKKNERGEEEIVNASLNALNKARESICHAGNLNAVWRSVGANRNGKLITLPIPGVRHSYRGENISVAQDNTLKFRDITDSQACTTG